MEKFFHQRERESKINMGKKEKKQVTFIKFPLHTEQFKML